MCENFKKFFNDRDSFAPNQRMWIFCVLIFIGGFFGGFTFSFKGKFFVNAQTGNMIILSTGIGNLNFNIIKNAIIMFATYFIGVMLAEYISKKIYVEKKFIWEKILLLTSSFVCFILGAIPNSSSFGFFLYPIALMVAMQFATFEKAQGMGMATGFCTNHLKQTAANLVRYLRTKESEKLRVSLSHFSMIFCFISGASVAVYLGNIFENKIMWLISIIFIITFIIFDKSIKSYYKD